MTFDDVSFRYNKAEDMALEAYYLYRPPGADDCDYWLYRQR